MVGLSPKDVIWDFSCEGGGGILKGEGSAKAYLVKDKEKVRFCGLNNEPPWWWPSWREPAPLPDYKKNVLLSA